MPNQSNDTSLIVNGGMFVTAQLTLRGTHIVCLSQLYRLCVYACHSCTGCVCWSVTAVQAVCVGLSQLYRLCVLVCHSCADSVCWSVTAVQTVCVGLSQLYRQCVL